MKGLVHSVQAKIMRSDLNVNLLSPFCVQVTVFEMVNLRIINLGN